MILADKILYHRKKLGLSQEELADQLGVSRQSISKWEGAQSIPDMDKIIKLSNLFSVSIDYLMKDEIEEPEYVEGKDNGTLRRVSLEEATTFIEANKKYAKNMAAGVFLCVSAPALLIMADKLFKNGSLGMLMLIPMIAIAVAVFIRAIHFMEPYKYLKEDSFELEYGVDSAVKREKEKYRNEHVKNHSLGVVLIIISIIPAIISDVLVKIPVLSSLAPSLLIALVAIGVHLLVKTGIYNSSFLIVLQEGDYTPGKKKNRIIYDRIAGIYWLTAVTLYLFMSFVFNKWESSWIIWPIAGVLFGLVSVIASIFIDD